jgi:2-polyprenyl-6-methoxyphenol hydroxylase-like FAD-dependent oxidoreductase
LWEAEEAGGVRQRFEIVVVGGGVAGLAAALAIGRAGHHVTVLERDALPADADPEEAFVSERTGAPQAHQTHGFLARVVVELRDHLPDVLDALIRAGGHTLNTTVALGDPQPGDEDLAVLVVRRTTFEWVLRNAALAEPNVTIRTGAAVTGLTVRAGTVAPPVVDGVTLADGSSVRADVVVAAMGRRSPIPQWTDAHGVHVDETIHESGLMYLTRWYRLARDRREELDPKLGGDLRFVKYLGVPGDGDTLSITLAIRPDDAELRTALMDPDGFGHACRLLPGPDQFFRAGPLEPVGGVRPMGGLLNRIRRFVDADGAPVMHGFHAIGDAHTCTNPLYGRGCSLALVHAFRLATALADHPDDASARARAFEAASEREVRPSYDFALQMDRMGADPSGPAALAGEGGEALAAVFVAGATDPVIGRALMRLWNLLATPEELMADPLLVQRVMEVMAHPEDYPPPAREGPSREELLAALAEHRASRAAAEVRA